ncbi:MAG TPA: ABC-F family ATP-binding cassette domain-containing protein [Stellaceae bacterium]|jgi:ATP-binding cassette subfamily F protein 3
MLSISGITYRIAGRTLIDDASAQIPDGWKVGLIGRNGTGKSTLLDLIRGERALDAGNIALPRDARIGFVAQEAPSGTTTPLQAVLAADDERRRLLDEAEHSTDASRVAEIHERLATIGAHSAEARAAGILAGLGFNHAEQGQPLSNFSGGWRMRVALAGVLFAEPELLLLDEPTNHLDLEASLWLADFLRRYRNTLLLVSHDRQFLDEVVDHILHLGERRLALYSGGYEDFARTRREHLARQQALATRQDEERRRLQAFIDRFRAKATKASQAQSRMKALARLQPISLSEEEPPLHLAFPEPPELAPPLLGLHQVSVGYEPEKPVLRRIDLRLDPDDRIALLGANGNGKSTFARLIAGRLPAMSGEITRAKRFSCGYFAQHQIEEFDPAASAYEHLARLMPKAVPETIRARLARFGFDEDKVFVAAQNLSGGEKARLNFALMSVDAPPMLILDEPTNHLDIEAREALVEAINEFSGAVVIVSHDWHLLSLVAERLWLVADGAVKPFEGDLDDYRRLVLAPTASESEATRTAANQRRETRRLAAERRRELEPLRRAVKETERAVTDLSARKAALDRRIADPATYTGTADVAGLLREQASLAAALGEAEARWLAAAEAIEDADAE